MRGAGACGAMGGDCVEFELRARAGMRGPLWIGEIRPESSYPVNRFRPGMMIAFARNTDQHTATVATLLDGRIKVRGFPLLIST